MFKLFKNSRSAKRHLPHILLNLHAIEKQLKPCYLWDAFSADVDEIQNYLNELKLCGKIKNHLSVFSVNDTFFVTQKELLRKYSEIFSTESVHVVDVSETKDEPSVLWDDQKRNALKPIINNVSILLKKLTESCDIHDRSLYVDFSVCNITTLYGALLGYPVLYWYRSQKPDAGSTSLSMVPLVIYRVTNCKEHYTNDASYAVNLSNRLYDHEIYSFSTPQSLIKDTENSVNNWFIGLEAKCPNSVFNNLTLNRGTVIVPYISM